MPELPEVECTRRSIEPYVEGRRIVAVTLGPHAQDAVYGPVDAASLLVGQTIAGIARCGKEMAILTQPPRASRTCWVITEEGGVGMGMFGRSPGESESSEPVATATQQPIVVVHLGMSGSLRHGRPGETAAAEPRTFPQAEMIVGEPDRHVHVTWQLDDGSLMSFRDPRRFGGLRPLTDYGQLCERWHARGEDALRIQPAQLHACLSATRRPIKAALLDQQIVAGLGNIYVDELLFGAKIHPLTPASRLTRRATSTLVRLMRSLLRRAIESGGSSLRDYVNAQGESGGFQQWHKAYGRGGQPCLRCKAPLESLLVGGRTTVCCVRCQPRKA